MDVGEYTTVEMEVHPDTLASDVLKQLSTREWDTKGKALSNTLGEIVSACIA